MSDARPPTRPGPISNEVSLCPHCRHDLRGSLSAQCPECGRAVTVPDSEPVAEPDAESAVALDLLHAFVEQTRASCPLCRYDLRGMSTNRCAECGHELALGLQLAEPRLGSWLILFVTTAISFGWSSSFSLIALTQADASWWRTLAGGLLITTLVLSTPALILALAMRRRFRRASLAVRLILTSVTAFVSAILLTVFIASFDG